MKEFIICAAIRHEDTGKIYYGHRHNQCVDASNGELSWKLNQQEISKIKREQGFITNENRFVDREEGLLIALEINRFSMKRKFEESKFIVRICIKCN